MATRRMLILPALAAIAAASAPASAKPVISWFTGPPPDISARLAGLCVSRSMLVVELDDHHVICSRPDRSFVAALAQSMANELSTGSPEQRLRFAIIRQPAATMVQASLWLELPMGGGEVQRQPLDGKKDQAKVISILTEAGGSLSPPTASAR